MHNLVWKTVFRSQYRAPKGVAYQLRSRGIVRRSILIRYYFHVLSYIMEQRSANHTVIIKL